MEVQNEETFTILAGSFKRVKNIIKGLVDIPYVDKKLLVEEAEKNTDGDEHDQELFHDGLPGIRGRFNCRRCRLEDTRSAVPSGNGQASW